MSRDPLSPPSPSSSRRPHPRSQDPEAPPPPTETSSMDVEEVEGGNGLQTARELRSNGNGSGGSSGSGGRRSDLEGGRRSGGSGDSGRSADAVEVETNRGASVGSSGTRSSTSSVDRRYTLSVVQQPLRSAEFGSNVLSRLPLNPPLIVKLEVHDTEGIEVNVEPSLPFLFSHLSLLPPAASEDATPVDLLVDPATGSPVRMLYGTLVSSPHQLTLSPSTGGTYFVFPDVSVRVRGRYRLGVGLMRIAGTYRYDEESFLPGSANVCASVVASSMKFGLSYQPHGATPLPWKQILVLCGVRLAEPINYSLIFPFINEMIVEETGVRVEDVGFYSGLVEGIFALVQFSVVYSWGSLSDRWGRRPIILMGLLGVAFSGTSFGLCKSFWMMCLTRSLNGLLCGNVVAVKASLGEITDETNQGVAFPVYGLTWVIGTVIGSTIGGYLSHPAERIPSLFGESIFLKEYPFFLPCGLSGCISICGWIFAFVFLEETLEKTSTTPPPSYSSSMAEDYESLELLPSPASPRSSSSQTNLPPPHRRSSSSISVGGGRRVEEEWTFVGLLKLPLVRRVVLSTFLMSMIAGSFGAVNLLVFYSPVAEGGLGMSASQTGTSLALNGIWTLLSQIAFLPPLQVAFGIATLYHYLNAGWIIVFFLLPFLNYLAHITGSTDSSQPGGGLSFWVWLAVAITLMFSTICNMAGSIAMSELKLPSLSLRFS
ncbi:major facilitator superfamily domain-containing protein [Mrakia frigida]|uniref:major facilitator superfamily domain-containing protein n=1 Tax=Mrakia frigida TaxID=29902 RepID=UPI003FCC18E2